ncbi:MAG: dienelactone hydrolase family protein [Limisphaerales bacterium]
MSTRSSFVALAALLAAAGPAFAADQPSPTGEAPLLFRTDHAEPLAPEEKAMDGGEKFTKLLVHFNGIAGDRVPGHLYRPKNFSGRRPAVLVQHGIGDKKKALYIIATCERLAALGVIALAIDAPNRGDRQDKNAPGISFLDPASVQKWFQQHCGDYSRAFDYLATRADVDAERLGYVGFSWGAITGITYAANDSRVRVMTSIGGGSLAGYLTMAAKPGEKPAQSLDPADHIARFAPRPLLLINSTKDQLVFPVVAKLLHASAGEGSEIKWYETDHFFNGIDRDAVLQSVAEYMKAKLEAATAKAK